MKIAHLAISAVLSVLTLQLQAQCNNVATNGDASGGLTGWNFSTGTGTNWTIQNNTYGSAFVSSYNWCTMNQTIDLWANGYSAVYLDNQQPEISYMQMYVGHTVNFADKYYFKVELRNSNNQVMDSYSLGSQNSPITTTSAWDTVSGSFTNYGNGARYVRIECGGDDAEYWAGYYGTVIDNTIISVEEILNVNICSGSYVWNGNTYSASGQYGGSFTGQYGCDSNVILNLHIGPYNIEDTFDLCQGDTFYFNGQAYTTDDTLGGNFTSYAGCDSNVSYIVHFRPSYDDTIDAYMCPGEGYNFGGQMLFTPGNYTGAFTSVHGCDSLVDLTLDFAPTPFLQLTDYFCAGEGYIFGDTTLNASGLYVRAFPSSYGCDSTVQLTLIQDQVYNNTFQMTLCDGQSIEFGSTTITEAGNYSETFATSGAGCDSNVTLEVDVISLNTGVTATENSLKSKDNDPNTTYRWLNCNQAMAPIAGAASQSFFPILGGSYAVEVTNGDCVDTSACVTFFPVGMQPIENEAMRVFPNPTDDLVTIKWTNDQSIEEVSLTNAMGQVVLTEKLAGSTQQTTIDLGNIPVGTYLLLVKGEEKSTTEILVVH